MAGQAAPTEPVRPPGRRLDPQRLLVAAVALVALALLKPWVFLGPVSPAAIPPRLPVARLATPDLTTPSPSLPPHTGVACGVPDGWRVVTLQRVAGRLVTTWIVVLPRLGAGPGDPDLPLTAVTGDLVGLGACAPGSLGGAVELAGLWQVPTGGAPVEARSAAPASDLPTTPVDDPARLYLVDAGTGSATIWPPGRYVLALRWPPGSSGPLFFLTVEVAPG